MSDTSQRPAWCVAEYQSRCCTPSDEGHFDVAQGETRGKIPYLWVLTTNGHVELEGPSHPLATMMQLLTPGT